MGAVDFCIMKIHRLGPELNMQPWANKTSEAKKMCLSPPHAFTMGMKQMTGWVMTSGTVGSNFKSETRTEAKIL
ncbi:hypothetical protein TNCV_371571 [Trichonephila clavipes]|nr:hypothetical protein TNCV_371571 [Trichonephila clavipes]